MWIRQNPLWLWNPEEMSPEIQNRGTSSPKIGPVNVSDKKIDVKEDREKGMETVAGIEAKLVWIIAATS